MALRVLYAPILISIHDYWKNHSFDCTHLCQTSKVMSLLFNTLSTFIIAFLSKSKCLLISWLQSPSVVILEPRKIKQYGALSIINYKKYLQNTLELVKFYAPLNSREGNGNPLQYSCLENPSHGQGSLAGYSPQGRKELDTTERLH